MIYLILITLITVTSAFAQTDSIKSTAQDTVATGPVFQPEQKVIITHIETKILNSFEDAKTHSDFEKQVYNFLHKLRFKTKPSVIRRNLLFTEGDTVRFEKVTESARNLRRNRFISDASIELLPNGDGSYTAMITSSDNWTTNAALNLSKPGEQWFYNIGLVEYDLLGYGIEAGVLSSKGPERSTNLYLYRDPHFLFSNHTLSFSYLDNSDGAGLNLLLQKPFISREDDWGYTAKWHNSTMNKFLYLGRTWQTPFEVQPIDQGPILRSEDYSTGTQVVTYSEAYTDSLSLRFTLATGTTWRNFFQGVFDRRNILGARASRNSVYTNNCSDVQTDDSFLSGSRPDLEEAYAQACEPFESDVDQFENAQLRYGISKSDAPDLFSRRDAMVGISHILQFINYRSVTNFQGAKWTEDIDLGFKIHNRIARNIPSLGAREWEYYFLHDFSFLQMLGSKHFFSGKASTDYFYNDRIEQITFGSQQANLSYVYKTGIWSTLFKSNYQAYFRSPESRQFQLGGFQGLTGFPDFYYAGQAIAWTSLEQRIFPGWEIGTAIPVPAVFLSAGNGWRDIESIDLEELEYSAGLGLRVGLSKSVLGIVNAFNVSWPLNGPRAEGLSGFVFTVTTEANF